jgi:predicted HAD superfamily Cof-like phosphohydrolase
MGKKYKKFNPVKKVAEFHKVSGNSILPKPEIPKAERLKLRVILIQEELDELKEAIEQNDFVEMADALTDILYVTIGSFLELGLGKITHKLFKEVHRSNMTKFCDTEEQAKAQVNWYMQNKGIVADYYEKGGKWILFNTATEKTIKRRDYSRPDLKSIIQKASK